MFPSFAVETITRLRAPMIDDGHHNTVPDPDSANWAEQDIAPVVVNPGATAEFLLGRDTTLIQWTVLAPAGADLVPTDHVRYRGVVYDIDGAPMRQASPTGALEHTVILLKAWEG